MTFASQDDRLASLLDELIKAMRTGQVPPLDRMLRENPDLADELRELWAAAMVADAVGQISNANVNTTPGSLADGAGSHATDCVASAPLPRTFGDYELQEELGRGGMGVVYKAKQLSLNRVVAVKMVLRADSASSSDLARFRAEAEAVARLEHPNIVPLYEVGEQDGLPYFSMKYVAGKTVGQQLAEGPMPPRKAASLLAPICRAVHYAHSHGVLHRDLKPSNLLVDADGRPSVTDFGLAKRMQDKTGVTRTGAVIGTPSYMAPEQAAGSRGEIGPASDVYALGSILYQMLTGRPPFQAASPVDTLLMVLEQEPLAPRVLNPKADTDLEMIALKAIQKPVEMRYVSALAMAEDLEAFLAGEPISARSGGFTQVLARVFRETHHAAVLENWGPLWIWHSVVLVGLCLITNLLFAGNVVVRWPYLMLWAGGLALWAPIFWAIRRRAGPVTFVERQIAHVWGAAVAASVSLFIVEWLLDLPVLTLSPVLGLINGMVFVVKAGILTGAFYFQAASLFATAGVMCIEPRFGISIFGLVSAACFFIPGWKYYRQSKELH